MRSLETAVGIACQIAYEYPDWGEEHAAISEELEK